MLTLKVDTKLLERKLSNASKQIPFAMSKALNDTADEVARRLTSGMDRHLDRPTPFTKRAFLTGSGRFKGKRATKRDLVAIVQADKVQNEYLKLNVYGGIRTPKRRAIMVPTPSARLNQYGNVSRGMQRQMVDERGGYFKGGEGMSPGIYKRTRKQVTMVASYETSTKYRRIYPVADIARDAIRYWWPVKATRSARMALATAR